jgi:hypothetical protein
MIKKTVNKHPLSHIWLSEWMFHTYYRTTFGCSARKFHTYYRATFGCNTQVHMRA